MSIWKNEWAITRIEEEIARIAAECGGLIWAINALQPEAMGDRYMCCMRCSVENPSPGAG